MEEVPEGGVVVLGVLLPGILLAGMLLGGSVLGVAVPVFAGGEHGPVAVADVPVVPVAPAVAGVDVPLDEAVPVFVPLAVDPVLPTPVEVEAVPAVPQFPLVVAVVPDGVVVGWLGVVVVVD